MADDCLSGLLAKLPTDLANTGLFNGMQEADYVAMLLDCLAEYPPWEWLTQRPIKLPYDFLLGLGTAMRLWVWELNNVRIHLDAGLPPAYDAMLGAFRSVSDPDAAARLRALRTELHALIVKRFAWNGRPEFDAEIILGDVNEDDLVESVAQFLWSRRHMIPDTVETRSAS
jgi:hypothetical protein